MKNIMEANIIRIFSFNQREMQSGVFYRTGSVWDDGSFRYVPAWDIVERMKFHERFTAQGVKIVMR